MPVMKNEFDIYKGGRSRNTSECSNNTNACRSRKVSETRSECPSLSTSPSTTDYGVHRNYMNRNSSRTAFSRTSSRTSQSSLTSPTKNCSPPKPSHGSQGSLNKFHVRLVDKLRKSFGKGRAEDRSWDQNDNDDDDDSNNPDIDDDPLSETSVAKQKLASSHQNDTTAINKPLKKLSISSDSSVLTSADSNDGGLGCSDSVLHITSSKPPLPLTNQRNRSRSIETASLKATYRHSTGSRLWSRHFSQGNNVHDFAEASKIKR